MRRLSGYVYVQFSVLSRLDGSALLRRVIWLFFGVQLSAKIQQLQEVVSLSRNWANELSCWFFLTIIVSVVGSVISVSVLSLFFIVIFFEDGLCGMAQFYVMFSIWFGFALFCSVYILRKRRKISERISSLVSVIFGAFVFFQCYCNQRFELTIESFFFAKQVDGRRNISVWIFDELISFSLSWFCQKLEVLVFSGSMVTRNFSFDR